MKNSLSIAVFALLISCGDNKASTIDAPIDSPDVEVDDGYAQVEHLARPGINEALIITTDFLNAYNATAPTFAGVPESALNQVVAEAKTVLKALYLGACLLNGALGLSPAAGVKPAGITCHVTGPAIWTENSLAGVELTAASKMAAQAYADKVFAQFIPDVMRIDTGVDSFYQTLCGDGTTVPLLCGGRFLNDDTIDITYDYLLNGAATPTSGAGFTYNQVSALVSDGVNFSRTAAQNRGSRIPTANTANNPQQAHPDVANTFPYSAAPQ
jgi:Domain of unknown function (DUF4331)